VTEVASRGHDDRFESGLARLFIDDLQSDAQGDRSLLAIVHHCVNGASIAVLMGPLGPARHQCLGHLRHLHDAKLSRPTRSSWNWFDRLGYANGSEVVSSEARQVGECWHSLGVVGR
jgi:hypothetical protein